MSGGLGVEAIRNSLNIFRNQPAGSAYAMNSETFDQWLMLLPISICLLEFSMITLALAWIEVTIKTENMGKSAGKLRRWEERSDENCLRGAETTSEWVAQRRTIIARHLQFLDALLALH